MNPRVKNLMNLIKADSAYKGLVAAPLFGAAIGASSGFAIGNTEDEKKLNMGLGAIAGGLLSGAIGARLVKKLHTNPSLKEALEKSVRSSERLDPVRKSMAKALEENPEMEGQVRRFLIEPYIKEYMVLQGKKTLTPKEIEGMMNISNKSLSDLIEQYNPTVKQHLSNIEAPGKIVDEFNESIFKKTIKPVAALGTGAASVNYLKDKIKEKLKDVKASKNS